MLRKFRSLFILFFFSILVAGCNGGQMPDKTSYFPSINDVPTSAWTKLSEKRIYFGHQSVGFNILEGFQEIMKENPLVKLRIVETCDPSDFDAPLFAHSTVGRNTDPASKISAFAEILEKGVGKKADIVLFKFCYVDFYDKTDIEKVFVNYKDTISRLKRIFPQMTFLHFTVPLTSRQTGIKAWIKRLIGRSIRGYEDNIKRNQFNKFLIAEYEGKDPVFDLAKVESTFPDGRQSSFTKDGMIYYTMVQEYTHDGGHLNEAGHKIAAEQLLVLMANVME